MSRDAQSTSVPREWRNRIPGGAALRVLYIAAGRALQPRVEEKASRRLEILAGVRALSNVPVQEVATCRMAYDLTRFGAASTASIPKQLRMHPDTTIDRQTAVPVESDGSLEQLALVLAHRLRGLVAGVEGFTDLLADTLIDPDQRELAWKIMECASRIESVLADLQLYGAPLEPVMLPVRVDELVGDLSAPLCDEERRRIDVGLGEPTAETLVLADPYLIRQALLILIRNALDATASGAAVRVESTRDDVSVCLHVWNEGTIGLANAAEIVFEPFFTTKAHNLGVGLSIARRIALAHGGSLVLSQNSRVLGTRFTIRIPEVREEDIR